MSFSTGNNSSQRSEINVTPLIDVLLVLLIIFMVIVPLTPTGLKAVVPQPPQKAAPPPPPEYPIILQVHSGSNGSGSNGSGSNGSGSNGVNGGALSYSINRQPVAKADLVPRLTAIFAARQERVMFVKGDPDIQFSSIAEVIGLGHQAMVTDIGVLTAKSESRE